MTGLGHVVGSGFVNFLLQIAETIAQSDHPGVQAEHDAINPALDLVMEVLRHSFGFKDLWMRWTVFFLQCRLLLLCRGQLFEQGTELRVRGRSRDGLRQLLCPLLFAEFLKAVHQRLPPGPTRLSFQCANLRACATCPLTSGATDLPGRDCIRDVQFTAQVGPLSSAPL